MENQIIVSNPTALDATALHAVQQGVIDSYQSTRDAFAGLQDNALKLIGHCVAVDSLAAINDTTAALVEAGEVGFAGNLRSWGARAMIGVVNDREANTLRVGAKRLETGAPLEFTPEFKAEPKAVTIAPSKARGNTKGEAKPVDPKAIMRLRKQIMERGLDGTYSDDQLAAVQNHLAQIVVTLGLV